MASLTKEQLKNELISHGVQPPVQSARKEEFVKLYEQHVAPIVAQKGDFSSDEETETNSEDKQVEVSNNSLVFNGLDITTISDEDLYSQLQSFGIPVGPIVDTTRSVYQRKLAALLQNGTTPVTEETEHTNGNGDTNEEKFSDSEEEEQVEEKEEDSSQPEVEEELFVQPSASQLADPVVISTPEPLTAIRKRMTMTDRPSSSFSALPLVDRQGTPTPRPSIHSLTGSSSSSQYTFESRRLLDTTDSSTVKQLPSKAGSSPNKPKFIGYILLLLALLAIAYIVYTYESIGLIKQLVENIRRNFFKYLEKAEEVVEKMDNAKPNPVPDV